MYSYSVILTASLTTKPTKSGPDNDVMFANPFVNPIRNPAKFGHMSR